MEGCSANSFWGSFGEQPPEPAFKRVQLPCGVTVAQQTLNLLVMVQIHARQPLFLGASDKDPILKNRSGEGSDGSTYPILPTTASRGPLDRLGVAQNARRGKVLNNRLGWMMILEVFTDQSPEMRCVGV